MNRKTYVVASTVASQIFNNDAEIRNFYDLRVQVSPEDDYFRIARTHISAELFASLVEGQVSKIVVDTLDVRGIASQLLPSRPDNIVLAVHTRDGQVLYGIPKSFVVARRLLELATVVFAFAGIWLASVSAFACAASWVLSTQCALSSSRIP